MPEHDHAEEIRWLGHTDQGARGDGVQVMVHDGHRPGSFVSEELIFATYQNAGVRAFDLTDPFAPREVAWFVPSAPTRMFDTRPGRPQVIQSCDVFVDADGVMYVTDYNAGLPVLQYEGP